MLKRLVFGLIIPGCLAVTASLLFFQSVDAWIAEDEDCPGTMSCVLDFGDGYVASLTMVVPQNEAVSLVVDVPNALMDQFAPPQVEPASMSAVDVERSTGDI